ncbi:hypothetical protein FACS189462_3270 [Spirochaetia bacterium]|nr:hypothetical protein FACS189462_3270 [Spirochaetia bacterium]
MDKQKTLAMIKEISDAPGVSGFEDEAVAALRRYSEGLGDLNEDAMRNLYLRRSGPKTELPVLQLDAHSDEVGFMIKAIRPNGTTMLRHIDARMITNPRFQRFALDTAARKGIPV